MCPRGHNKYWIVTDTEQREQGINGYRITTVGY